MNTKLNTSVKWKISSSFPIFHIWTFSPFLYRETYVRIIYDSVLIFLLQTISLWTHHFPPWSWRKKGNAGILVPQNIIKKRWSLKSLLFRFFIQMLIFSTLQKGLFTCLKQNQKKKRGKKKLGRKGTDRGRH